MSTRARRKPLIASTLALRALAAALTLSSFGGMAIFASENLHTTNAPLQPAAVAAATPTTAAPTTVTTSRTTVRTSVTSTTTTAVTRTKQS